MWLYRLVFEDESDLLYDNLNDAREDRELLGGRIIDRNGKEIH